MNGLGANISDIAWNRERFARALQAGGRRFDPDRLHTSQPLSLKGFSPFRVSGCREGSTCSLYMFGRDPGRLFWREVWWDAVLSRSLRMLLVVQSTSLDRSGPDDEPETRAAECAEERGVIRGEIGRASCRERV